MTRPPDNPRQVIWPPEQVGSILHNPYLRTMIPTYVEQMAIAENAASGIQGAQARMIAEVVRECVTQLIVTHRGIHDKDDLDVTNAFNELVNIYQGKHTKDLNSHDQVCDWEKRTQHILNFGPSIGGRSIYNQVNRARRVLDLVHGQLMMLTEEMEAALDDCEDGEKPTAQTARRLKPGDLVNLRNDVYANPDQEIGTWDYEYHEVVSVTPMPGGLALAVEVEFSDSTSVIFPAEHRVLLPKDSDPQHDS